MEARGHERFTGKWFARPAVLVIAGLFATAGCIEDTPSGTTTPTTSLKDSIREALADLNAVEPLVPACIRYFDQDCDDIPNANDADIDGDNLTNDLDPYPYVHLSEDRDGDGIPIGEDPHPFINEWSDEDGDGVVLANDWFEGNDFGDEDGDFIENWLDPFPYEPDPESYELVLEEMLRTQAWQNHKQILENYNSSSRESDRDHDGRPDRIDIHPTTPHWRD